MRRCQDIIKGLKIIEEWIKLIKRSFMKYIGIDLHRRFSQICVYDEQAVRRNFIATSFHLPEKWNGLILRILLSPRSYNLPFQSL